MPTNFVAVPFSHFLISRWHGSLYNMGDKKGFDNLHQIGPCSSMEDLQAVRDIRKLIIDLCRQNNGGHGGSAIGMAPIAVSLWRHVMRYNPLNPEVRCLSSYNVSLVTG